MALYSKIDRRIWVDAKFRALSEDAKLLWLYLLTCPENGSMPGLLRIGKAALAEALEWFPERFPKRLPERFAELTRNGMAKADWDARLIYLPNALRYNAPPNPNVVASWAEHWDNLPECDLKSEAFEAFSSEMKRLGEPFAKRFAERLPKPSRNGLANGMRKQEQEQEQDLILHSTCVEVPAPVEVPASETKPKRTRTKPAETSSEHSQVVAVWFQLFEKAKGTKPVFNGGKDGRAVKVLLEAFGNDVDKITQVFRNAFADAWWTQHKASLADIAANPNRFLTAQVLPFDRKKPVVQTGGWKMDDEENERKLKELFEGVGK